MKNENLNNWMRFAIIVVIVVGGGLFIVNQFFSWKYKVQLLTKPCDLCISLNPNFTRCNVEIIRIPENQMNNIDWNKYLPTANSTP